MERPVNQDVEVSAQQVDTDSVSKPKRRINYVDRLSILPKNLEKLGVWISQAQNQLKGGIEISRSDLVNFLIEAHNDKLSSAEMKQIERQFFDEVKFAKWALRELKAAKDRGESTTLADILNQSRQVRANSSPSPEKVKRSKIAKNPEKSDENNNLEIKNFSQK